MDRDRESEAEDETRLVEDDDECEPEDVEAVDEEDDEEEEAAPESVSLLPRDRTRRRPARADHPRALLTEAAPPPQKPKHSMSYPPSHNTATTPPPQTVKLPRWPPLALPADGSPLTSADPVPLEQGGALDMPGLDSLQELSRYAPSTAEMAQWYRGRWLGSAPQPARTPPSIHEPLTLSLSILCPPAPRATSRTRPLQQV